MRSIILLFLFITPLLFHFTLDNSYAVTGYELERDYWKNRKDLSRKERLTKMDDAYTKRYGDDSGSGSCCCVVIILAIGFGIYSSIKNQKTMDNLLLIANQNGFNINDENKKCPKCAELIKLESRKCMYCGQSFSEKQKQDTLKERLENFLAEKGISLPVNTSKIAKPKTTKPPSEGRIDNSEKATDEAAEKSEQNDLKWIKKGLNFYKLGEYKEAIISFTNAIDSNNQNDVAYYYRAVTYNKIKAMSKVKEDITMSAKLGNVKAMEYSKKYYQK